MHKIQLLILILLFLSNIQARFTLFSDKFHSVEKGQCYRSKQPSPNRLRRYIRDYGIKTVINLRGENPDREWWLQEQDVAVNNNIEFINIALNSNSYPKSGDISKLLRAFQFAPRPVLLHCWSGVDRTGLASALWVLEQKKGRLKDATRHLSYKYGHVQFLKPKMKEFVKLWELSFHKNKGLNL